MVAPSSSVLWTVVAMTVLAAACTGSDADQPDAAAVAAFNEAVSAENGVPVIVADDTSLGDLVEVTRHPDSDGRDVWRFLARADDSSAPLVSVEIRPDVVLRDLRTDRLLSSGRAVEIDRPDTGVTFLKFTGQRSEFVQIASRDLEFDELFDIAGALRITDRNIDEMPEGWTEVGAIDLPYYADGFTAMYRSSSGTSFITTTRVRGDAASYLAWAPAVEIDDSKFERAWMIDVGPPDSRYVVQYNDDFIVEITGELADDQFRGIVDNLRIAEVGEFDIQQPDF